MNALLFIYIVILISSTIIPTFVHVKERSLTEEFNNIVWIPLSDYISTIINGEIPSKGIITERRTRPTRREKRITMDGSTIEIIFPVAVRAKSRYLSASLFITSSAAPARSPTVIRRAFSPSKRPDSESASSKRTPFSRRLHAFSAFFRISGWERRS